MKTIALSIILFCISLYPQATNYISKRVTLGNNNAASSMSLTSLLRLDLKNGTLNIVKGIDNKLSVIKVGKFKEMTEESGFLITTFYAQGSSEYAEVETIALLSNKALFFISVGFIGGQKEIYDCEVMK